MNLSTPFDAPHSLTILFVGNAVCESIGKIIRQVTGFGVIGIVGLAGSASTPAGASDATLTQITLTATSIIGGSEIYPYSASGSAPIINGAPIYPYNLGGTGQYSATQVVDQPSGTVLEGSTNNFWLAPDNETGAYFVIDFGQPASISRIELFNTHNNTGGDRGTKDFKVEASNQVTFVDTYHGSNLSDSVVVLSGTLPFSNANPIIASSYTSANGLTGGAAAYRYLRFTALSYYQTGAGLSEIRVFTDLTSPPTITTQPSNVTVTAGQTASLTVSATGAGSLSYQWRRNGFPLSGATATTFTVSSATRTDADFYDVVVSGSGGSTISAVARLSVAPTSYPGGIAPDPAWDIYPEYDDLASISAVVPLADGRCYVAGRFTSANGIRATMVLRLKADGSFDPSFAPPHIDSPVQTLAVQPDGKIVVGGDFSRVGGLLRRNLARLNPDGSHDLEFLIGTGVALTVNALAVQPDGRILVAGIFGQIAGATSNNIVRLNADGTPDPTFNGGTGANNTVFAVALQPDGRIVIGGAFTTVDGTTANRLARLTATGALDPSFALGSGANNTVYALALQSDGSVLLGGDFTAVNGTTANRIARVSGTGTIDTDFSTATGIGFSNTVRALLWRSDGRILAGGGFATFNGVSRSFVAQLTSSGARDTTFTPPNPNRLILGIAIQSDGRLLLGGQFSVVGAGARSGIAQLSPDGSTLDSAVNIALRSRGQPARMVALPGGKLLLTGQFNHIRGVAVPGGVARLNGDGTLDASFNAGGSGTSGEVYAAAALPDGRIAICGNFTSYNGTVRNRVALLKTDGTLDTSFNPTAGGLNNLAYTLAVLSEGRILVVGEFSSANGTALNRIAVFKPDGTLESTFAPGTAANGSVLSCAVQSDGKIVLGGAFTAYNGAASGRVVRINPEGTLDPLFNPGTGSNSVVYAVALQPNGKVFVAGAGLSFNGTSVNRIVRLNADGSRDSGFVAASLDSTILGLLAQEDGKVIVRGVFSTVGGNTTTPFLARLNADGTFDPSFDAAGFLRPGAYTATVLMRDNGQLFTASSGGEFVASRSAAAPVVVSQPVGKTANAGASVTFAVEASSAAPLSYQWLFNGIAIPGAYYPTLTLNAATQAQSGAYSVTVSSELGSVTSAAAMLSVVNAPPTFALQPASVTVAQNQPATFNVVVAGEPAPTLQWKKSGIAIAGATGSTLTIASAQPTDEGVYVVAATNAVGSVTSSEATLTVHTAPVIVTQPAGTSVTQGQTATLSVVAAGKPTPTFQWKKGVTALVGATGSTLVLTNAQPGDAGTYSVVVTNAVGEVTSNVATVNIVAPAPTITAMSAARQVVGLGQSLTLSVTAIGATSYQWRRNGKAISGATAANFAVANAAMRDGGWYQVTAANEGGATTSAAMFRLVAPASTQVVGWGGGYASPPTNLTTAVAIAAGQSSGHSLALKSDGTVVEWNTASVAPAVLTDVVAVAAGEGHALALKADGTVVAWGDNSRGQAVVPANLANVVSIAAGNRHSLALLADGTVVSWGDYHAGNNNYVTVPVPAGLSNVVAVAAGDHSLALKADGSVIAWGSEWVRPTNVPPNVADVVGIAVGAFHSVAVKTDGTVAAWGINAFGVLDLPAGLSDMIAVSAGQYFSLALKTDGTLSAWGWNDVSQTTLPSGLTNVVSIASGGAHSLALRRVESPSITTQPQSQTATVGDTATFAIVATGTPAPTYQWKKGSVEIVGATSATLTLLNVQPTDVAPYTVVATNSVGTTTSLPATLTVGVPGSAPVLTSFSPMSGPPGRIVTLNGSNFGLSVGDIQTSVNIVRVYFGGAQAPSWIEAISGAIRVIVPSGAVTGYVTVSTSAGTTSSANEFTMQSTGPVPVNDLFANAESIGGASGEVVGSNTFATRQTDEPNHAGNQGSHSVWYRWRAPVSGYVVFDANDSEFGPYLGVYTGTVVNALTSVGTVPFTRRGAASAILNAQANTEYFIAIDADRGANGTLRIKWAPLSPPTITGFTPTSLYAGQILSITGTGFSPTTTVKINGQPASGVVISSDTSIAIRAITVNMTSGLIEVTNPVGSGVSMSGVTLLPPPAPIIASFSPTSGVTDSLVDIYGTALSLGVTPVVRFGGVAATTEPNLNSGILGRVRVPPNALTGRITVETSAGLATSATDFVVTSPAITHFSPASGITGAMIVITGANFNSATAVRLGGVAADFIVDSPNQITATAPAGASTGKIEVVTPNGTAASAENFTIVAPASPTITVQPTSQTSDVGGSVTLTVAATGVPAPTYQWNLNGTPITGATGSQLLIVNAQPSSAGSYTVAVTNMVGTVTSNAVTLTIRIAPAITLHPLSQFVVAPSAVTLTGAANGVPTPTYRWRKDGIDLPGATQSSLTFASTTTAHTGAYAMVVTNAAGTVTSNTAVITVIEASATQSVASSGYIPGANVAVNNTFTFSTGLAGFSWQVLLPSGWSFVSDGGNVGEIKPAAGATDLLEWRWTTVAPSPLTFSYTLRVPVDATGDKSIAALVTLDPGPPPIQMVAQPDPLVVRHLATHSADTNRDFRLSLLELTRVIELFNTRYGTVRTGAYRVQDGTEDGFLPEPGRADDVPASLPHYHSADTGMRDARIGLVELTRVIELYNTRAGTVRTGQYRVQSGTEDGFAPGP